MKSRLLATALALCLGPMSAQADALSDAQATYMAAWDAAPLVIRKALFVVTPAEGIGMFEERPMNVFAQDEPIYIYLRPEGYGWAEVDGRYEFGLDLGVRILGANDALIYENPEFLTLKTASREKALEFFGNVTLTLTDFPPSTYTVELHLSDIASDKTADVTMSLLIE